MNHLTLTCYPLSSFLSLSPSPLVFFQMQKAITAMMIMATGMVIPRISAKLSSSSSPPLPFTVTLELVTTKSLPGPLISPLVRAVPSKLAASLADSPSGIVKLPSISVDPSVIEMTLKRDPSVMVPLKAAVTISMRMAGRTGTIVSGSCWKTMLVMTLTVGTQLLISARRSLPVAQALQEVALSVQLVQAASQGEQVLAMLSKK